MGLATIMAGYRTRLEAAQGGSTYGGGLTNLPEGEDIDQLPATKDHKVYRLSLASQGALGDTSGAGSLVEYRALLRLEVFWNPEIDTEAIYATIASDVEAISQAMLRDTGKPAGAILCRPESLFAFDESPNRIKGTATYSIRYRIAQDLS